MFVSKSMNIYNNVNKKFIHVIVNSQPLKFSDNNQAFILVSTYVVKRLDQAKLLTDPFKLTLLERFSGDPVTTKQVADQMGEKAPRLYRHVDALFDAGLLKLVKEKPKRGTVERYYRTIASRFEVDPELFTTSAENLDEGVEMMRSLLRETESELVRLFSSADKSTPDARPLPLLMRLAVRGTDDEIGRLRDKLDEWLNECEALAESGEGRNDGIAYAGLLAFYPQVDDRGGEGGDS
jgi:DNA-binding transcriptional ArsR family regulator